MEDLTRRCHGVSRRHLMVGAVGAMALPIATPGFGKSIEAMATEADEGFMRIALEEAALGDYPTHSAPSSYATAPCWPAAAIFGISSRIQLPMPR
jgi:hypothetical protein